MERSEDAQYDALLHYPQETTLFQKNLLVTPESPQNKEWDLLDRSSQSQIKMAQKEKGKNKQKDKGKDKSGTGHRLLNMLKKTIKGAEKKEEEVELEKPALVPFGDVVGCLAVHIKSCRNFSSQILSRLYYTNLFIRLTISNVVKLTRMCTFLSQGEKNITAKFDDVKYFSVQVPRRQDDVRNNIFLELLECENTASFPVLLGTARVHLYEVIQKGCFTEEFQISSKSTLICRVEIEFKFSYGNFGFGFSHQLKPLQKIIEPSMFMSVVPPPERIDPVSNVIMPQPLEYPAFLSPDLNVTIGKPSKANQPSVVRLDKLQEPPRKRLEKIKKEYRTFNTWEERSSYIENLLNPTSEKKDSEESSITEEQHENPPNLPLQVEEKLEIPDPPRVYEEVPPIPKKPPESEKMTSRFLTVPAFNLPTLNEPDYLLPIRDEPEKPTYLLPTDLPVSARPTVEENITSSDEQLFPPPEIKSKPRYPRSVKIDTSPPEEQYGDTIATESPPSAEKDDHYLPAVSAMDLQKVHIKDGFDPFLRNINNRVSGRKWKDQDMPKCRKSISSEIIEHEDQDPPYPAHSKTEEPSSKTKAHEPDIITIQPLDTNLKGRLPNASLSSFERKSSTSSSPLSKSSSSTKSLVPKLILSKNLKDLLDEFFYNPTIPLNLEASKKSSGSLNQRVQVKPSSNLKDVPLDFEVRKKSSGSLSQCVQDKPSSSLEDVPLDFEASKKSSGSLSQCVQDKSSSTVKDLPLDLEASKKSSGSLSQCVQDKPSSSLKNLPLDLEASKKSSGSLNQRVQDKPSSTVKDLPLDLEASKKSSGSLSQCVQDKPSSSVKDLPLDLEASKKSSGSLSQRVQDKPSSSVRDLPLDLEASKKSSGSLNQGVQGKPSSSVKDLPLDLEASKKSSGSLNQGVQGKPSSSVKDLPLDLEASKKSSGSLSQRVQDKPSSSVRDLPLDLEASKTSSGSLSQRVQGKPSSSLKNLPLDLEASKTSSGSLSQRVQDKPSSSLKDLPLDLEASKTSSGSLSQCVQDKPSSSLKDLPLDLEASKKSSGSLSQCVQDKPSSSLKDLPLDLEASKKSSGSLSQRVQDKPSSSLKDLPLDLEASKKSSGSLSQCVQDKPSSSLKDLPLDLEASKKSSGSLSQRVQDKPSSSLKDLPLDLEASKKSNGSLSQCVQDKPSSSLKDLPLDLEASKKSSGSLSQRVQDKPSSSLKDLPLDLEASKKSSGSLSQRVQDKPSSSLEEETFEKIPDSKSWSSEKNILTSKKPLSEISKGMSVVSLSEGRSGSSLGTERKPVSAKDLENCVIKQIFTAQMSKVDSYVKELSERKVNMQDQLPTASASSIPSQTGPPWDKQDDAVELSLSTSALNQTGKALSKDVHAEHGQVNMLELDQQHQGSSLVASEKGCPAEKQNSPTEELSKSQIKLKSPSDDSVPTIPAQSSCELKVASFTEEGQNTPPRDSDYHPSIPETETNLPRVDQTSYKEEPDLNTILENLSNSLMSIINGSDPKILNSLLKHILSAFYKFSQSARRPPEREVPRQPDRSFTPDVEDHEEIQEAFTKADSLDQKPMLNPKLGVFLEELSKAEIKKLKSELSKHIQHYLVERLSKSGHITKEDLPKIYQNLYVMNEKSKPSGQNVFQEKYSETAKEIVTFVNNFHHYFIDKHLEIKLRSFLSEILKNYFLENLSGSKLFKETEPSSILSTTSLRAKSASGSLHDSDQDVSRGSSDSWFDINTVYPLTKSLQSSLMALSENELLNLKTDLSKCIQTLFIEKLSKSGLLTKRQLEGISQQIHLNNPSSTPLKCVKTDLGFRDESKYVEEHSEKQNKYSKMPQKATLQKIPEARWVGTELIRKEEKEGFPLHGIKENLPILADQKSHHSKEGGHTPCLMKVQPCTSKNIQAISMSKPSDRPMSAMFKNPRNEYSFLQLPPAENAVLKVESQDPYGGDGTIIQSNACFERTLRMKSVGKKEQISIYKLTVQGRPEARLSPYPRVLDYKMSDEEEESARRLVFPSCQGHPSNHLSSEVGVSKLESQRWKGNNNNNKKQSSVTFAEYQQIQSPYKKPSVIGTESYADVPESQPFRCEVLEVDTYSKPPLFPELLKREGLKPKLQRERDHFGKQRKTYSKVVKILPTTVPSSRTHLKKSIPRTLLHWTARTTIHDCSDKFEDLPPAASFKHLERTKSRTRLLGKYSGNNPNPPRHATRPNTAPEATKRQREGHTGKLKTPRLVSASLAHINDTISHYEMHKMQPKKQLKETIENCPLICNIIQVLNTSE
ncbi:cation channel sperm-associated targeting subunit tau [Tenrec ecaudatus]|uniref:cation channel sperm-associated targeting subunit tau n=1 Tax=Tenrec ecaudatus TaxID=94439 RepID=UPI003F5A73F8